MHYRCAAFAAVGPHASSCGPGFVGGSRERDSLGCFWARPRQQLVEEKGVSGLRLRRAGHAGEEQERTAKCGDGLVSLRDVRGH